MRKSLIAAAVAGLVSLPSLVMAQAAAPASPHTFTGNVGFATEYLYRGIAQTRGKPALQGGFDYAHASGLYAGAWGSNISWIGDAVAGASASLEIDVYGGYKGSFGGDFGYDIGVLTYNYPGTGKTVTGVQELKQDTTEVYGALSWKWLTVKYSHSTGALFGWPKNPGALTDKTTGSGYLELNAAYDLGNGWGITGHVGDQKVKGNGPASYSDYKLGVTKDVGFGVVGLAYSSTNAQDSCTGAAATTANDVYCFVNNNGTNAYSAGKDKLVATFSKTF
ncbi:TorF family putative porin [Sulfuritalea sp.]|uniref:TorF family putative porin n=1 Tax=Sulfuritalea sp. TaxID=2480090 RepID=UPI00286EA838|nr:TorF family putative porin [Sulfuritalea sp.]